MITIFYNNLHSRGALLVHHMCISTPGKHGRSAVFALMGKIRNEGLVLSDAQVTLCIGWNLQTYNATTPLSERSQQAFCLQQLMVNNCEKNDLGVVRCATFFTGHNEPLNEREAWLNQYCRTGMWAQDYFVFGNMTHDVQSTVWSNFFQRSHAKSITLTIIATNHNINTCRIKILQSKYLWRSATQLRLPLLAVTEDSHCYSSLLVLSHHLAWLCSSVWHSEPPNPLLHPPRTGSFRLSHCSQCEWVHVQACTKPNNVADWLSEVTVSAALRYAQRCLSAQITQFRKFRKKHFCF